MINSAVITQASGDSPIFKNHSSYTAHERGLESLGDPTKWPVDNCYCSTPNLHFPGLSTSNEKSQLYLRIERVYLRAGRRGICSWPQGQISGWIMSNCTMRILYISENIASWEFAHKYIFVHVNIIPYEKQMNLSQNRFYKFFN